MKIKMLTHTDLDGIGCATLGILFFGKENVDIEYCNYEDIDKKINDMIISDEFNKYDKIFITDISVNEQTSSIIDNIDNLKKKIMLIDHHPTALNLNKYSWCKVIIEDEIEKVSGTSLFYKELEKQGYFTRKYTTEDITDSVLNKIDYLVEKIKRYDTWLWSTKYNDLEAKQLNDLFFIYGRERFIDKILKTFGKFDDTDKLFLEVEQENIGNYINKKDKELRKEIIIIKNCKGIYKYIPKIIQKILFKSLIKKYTVGVVFAEQYISELGNQLANRHTELDFIIIISATKISYRGIKQNINLGEFAKLYGGGGHPQSAGSSINKEKQLNYIKDLFKS